MDLYTTKPWEHYNEICIPEYIYEQVGFRNLFELVSNSSRTYINHDELWSQLYDGVTKLYTKDEYEELEFFDIELLMLMANDKFYLSKRLRSMPITDEAKEIIYRSPILIIYIRALYRNHLIGSKGRLGTRNIEDGNDEDDEGENDENGKVDNHFVVPLLLDNWLDYFRKMLKYKLTEFYCYNNNYIDDALVKAEECMQNKELERLLSINCDQI